MSPRSLRSLVGGGLLALVVIALGGAAGRVIYTRILPAPAAAQQASTGDYFPLAVGNRWELRSRTAPDPMVLEVTGRDGNAFIVRWINPFVQATFRFERDATRVLLVGLDMGQGNSPIPANTAYWDFGLREGQRWQSAVGVGEVSDRGITVNTPSGRYPNAVEIRTIDRQGQSMYWTFAPNVGLIRWGRGGDAFLLTSFRPSPPTGVQVDTGPTAIPRVAAGGSDRVLIGLDATPHEKNGDGKNGKRAALQQAWEAGMTLLHSSPKWDEFEKSEGKYDLNDDADAIGEFADEKNLPIALCFRIVDTNQRSMPDAYERWRFDEERTAERLRSALRAMPRVYKERTRYLAIGNEVNEYFNSRGGEIAAYATLMRRVLDTVRQEFPNAQFTVNFTFSAVGGMDRYRAITDLTDFSSFTYYPLNADFTMRDPSVVRGDIGRMLSASGDRQLYIQEIGYASAERLNSSPQKQAEFYRNAFATIREQRNRMIGATFLFMSDFSQFIVDFLAGYYGAANSENFKAYLQTLGIFERDGTPKPAVEVFRREALSLRDGR
jgi:hypothetical protein